MSSTLTYFFIEPEVAGGLGDNSVFDRSTHPPQVHRLHYEFDGWLGDVLLAGFPCLIATEEAARALKSGAITGIIYATMETSTSELFRHLYPGRQLPTFVWLQINGTPGEDDFGWYRDTRGEQPRTRYVISKRVLDILRPMGLNHAEIEPFAP